MACLPQLGSVPAAYAVVAGGCDWPLPSAVGLPKLTSLRNDPLRSLLAWVALDGNPALGHMVLAHERLKKQDE